MGTSFDSSKGEPFKYMVSSLYILSFSSFITDIINREDAYRKPGKQFNSRDPQLVTYSGSENHRNYIKEYLKKENGLYSNRSHCHIVLVPYTTLVSESLFFSSIVWDALILDEPFGLISNYFYGKIFIYFYLCLLLIIMIYQVHSLNK